MAYDLTARLSLVNNLSRPLRQATKDIERARRASDQLSRTQTRLKDTQTNLGKRMKDAFKGIELPSVEIGRFEQAINGISGKVPAIALGLSAAVSVAGPLTAAIGGLSASLAAAGIGAVAFGAVAVSSLGKIFEAAEDVDRIQEKIDNATTTRERIKAQTELAQLYGDMSKAQRGALKELQTFKSFWGDFTKQFETPVFQAFDTSLEIMRKGLTLLAPTISNVSGVVNELLNSLNNAMNGSGAKEFFTWLENNAAESLRSFGTIAANVLGGVFGLFKAFAPAGASVEEGLIGMTARFKEWAMALENNKSFHNFLEYAKTNTPVVMTALKNMFIMTADVIKALAPVGTMVMQVIGQIAGFVHENFGVVKAAVTGLIAAFAGFKIVTTVIAIVRGAIVVFNNLKKAFGLARTGFTLLRAAMLLFPGGWIIAAVTAVIAIGVALYRNWDTVKEKAGQLWAKMKDVWQRVKDWTSETWNSVKEAIGNAMDSAKEKVRAFFDPLLGFIDDAKSAWKSFTGMLGKIKLPKLSLPSIGGVFGGGGGKSKTPKKAFHGEEFVSKNLSPYLLHRGEMVLTREQADRYRAQRGGAGNNVYLTVNYDGSGPLNEQQMDVFGEFLVRKITQAMDAGA